ncbi:hypothetical protein COPEUT_02921 [Coprococcus eutactus ATCC 27759]|nr:hypothetical protein COPEUT_02921 [Coprococcus eutactus ATCC 27759]
MISEKIIHFINVFVYLMHLLKQFIQYSFVNSTINLHFYTCTFLFNVSGNVKAYMAFCPVLVDGVFLF